MKLYKGFCPSRDKLSRRNQVVKEVKMSIGGKYLGRIEGRITSVSVPRLCLQRCRGSKRPTYIPVVIDQFSSGIQGLIGCDLCTGIYSF